MIIPSNFTVSDVIIEHVRVAPEEWPEVTTPTSAADRLRDLRSCMQNPDILYIMCQMVRDLAQAESQIDSRMLAGFHDIINQQQLIGEKRGLRRFFAELQTIHENLTSAAQS